MSADLPRALQQLAAGITGEPPTVHGRDDAVAPGAASRPSLLAGAALLTGRGDLAQDAVHVGLTRARLAGAADDPIRVCTEVLGAARAHTDGA